MSTSDPTPQVLRLVHNFVNSTDIEAGRDDIGSPSSLGAWLAERGLLAPDSAIEHDDVERASAFREAIRSLLVINSGGPVDPDALSVLDRVAESVPMVVHIDGSASRLVPKATGLDTAFGRMIADIHTAMADGTWTRLKACAKHSCRWAFYDTSKNRSRTWCSMKVCGNRVKARRFREKQKD